MLLATSLDEIPQLDSPCGLTIGTFDGVHLGHQSLLKALRVQLPAGGILAALTFSNHPSHLFSCLTPVPLICPPLQKVKYLFEHGVDLVILVPFDKEFAQIPYDDFLMRLKKRLGFTSLVLGEGATFGEGKEGNEAAVRKLEKKLDFKAEYLRKLSLDHHCISSGRIRELIQQGDFKQVSESLGRPYSLMGYPILKDNQLFCPFPGICLPPEGEYVVKITKNSDVLVERTIAKISLKEQGIYLIQKSVFDKASAQNFDQAQPEQKLGEDGAVKTRFLNHFWYNEMTLLKNQVCIEIIEQHNYTL